MERRGSMYDPLVVDTFIRVYRDISPSLGPSGPSPHALDEITSSAQPLQSVSHSNLDRQSGNRKPGSVRELAQKVGGQTTLDAALRVMASELANLVTFTHAAVFVYDVRADELEARWCAGYRTGLPENLRIPRGQKLSGWVAANRQTISNSDPRLDLGPYTDALELRSCLSTPLVSDDGLVGVLTIYSPRLAAFDANDERLVEQVSAAVAATLRERVDHEHAAV